MDKQRQDPAYFISFGIEQYKNAKGMNGEETMRLFEKYGVLEYLHDFYDVLHTQSHEWLLADIDEFISIRQKEKVNSYYEPCSSNRGLKMWHLGPVDLYRELRDKN